MHKRIFALLCILAVLAGALTVAAAASMGTDRYQVGYSKKDVNPWIQNEYTGELGIANRTYADADTYVGQIDIQTQQGETVTVPFVKTPLSGYGAVTTRLADNLTDDNGDGIVGLGDGIFTTATSVTDKWGTTVLYITLDNINGYNTLTSTVRTQIMKAFAKKGYSISAKQIMLSASHSHEAPILGDCYSSWNKNMNTANTAATGEVTALGTYWLYYLDQITAAALEAYETRSDATMTKGAIDASSSMADMGYKYSDGTGYQLNFVRHYNATVQKQQASVTHGTPGSWKNVGTPVNAVVGDNFGSTGETYRDANTPMNGTINRTMSTITSHVTESDDTMYILKFDRAESAGNDIVLVNWRAHASINGHSTFTNLSSDYVNALRYRLEHNTDFGGDQNYCVGFWQGAGGNYNNTSRISAEYKYSTPNSFVNLGYPAILLNDKGEGNDVKVPPLATVQTDGVKDFYDTYYSTAQIAKKQVYKDEFYRSALYGYLLGKVALDCLDSDMSSPLDCGEIRTVQNNYAAGVRTYTEGEIAAAAAWNQAGRPNTSGTFPYVYTYKGERISLNSYYHAYYIVNRSSASSVTMELNVITLGKNVAMVTATGELFDNYDLNKSTAAADNDWLELIDVNLFGKESYGTPFVLGYSNNSTGYAPNALAYDYYTDTTATVAVGTAMGSYEANTTALARGTGEALIQQYKQMLDTAYNGYLEYACPECGKMVSWAPLTASQANANPGTGHYYLTENLAGTGSAGQKAVGASDSSYAEKICLDLNGYTYSSETRCAIIYKGSTLSIFDMRNNVPGKNSGSTGMMIGHSFSNNPGGGAFSVNAGATVNLYGGTLKFEKVENDSWYGTGVGGVMSLSGTLNMYGGTIQGGDVVMSTYSFSTNGCGGAIYVYAGAAVNMTGGKITSGSVPEGGYGPCVYLAGSSSKISLSGNADVDDIYCKSNNGSNLTVSGNYTGTAKLSFDPGIDLEHALDVGNATADANISGGKLTCATDSQYGIVKVGTNLLLSRYGSGIIDRGDCGDNLQWVLSSEGVLTISGTGAMWDHLVQRSVPWYSYRKEIKNIIIGDDVSHIGSYAFYGCSEVERVTLGADVTSVELYAFRNCTALTTITIQPGVTRIGKGAFLGCTSLALVRYCADQEQWEQITIDDNNEPLSDAQLEYNASSYLPGDFDSNGKVTDADALYLLRYTLFPDRYPVEQPTDVNGDGMTSDADALYLLRHTLFPDRYPLN